MATAQKAAAKKTGGAVVKWDEALAARAKIAKKTEESISTGNFVSLKGGIMTYAGNAVPGNKLDVVVVSYVMENAYYEGVYDPNTPQTPVCYAFGVDEDDMRPHDKVENPVHPTCKGCPNNEWGSAEQGRGKACKNQRRLAIITDDVLDGGADAIAAAKESFVKVPVTSVKGWAGYVNQLAGLSMPPLGFVTTISVTPDAQSQFKVSFNAKEQIDDGALLGALLTKADVVDKTIGFPYMPASDAPAPARGGRTGQRQAAKPRPRQAAAPMVAPPSRSARAPAAKKAKKF